MRVRRLRAGHWATVWAVGLMVLETIGCSQQEELPLDPGVSPFYPGDAGSSKAPVGPGAAGDPSGGSPASAGIADGRAGPNGAGSPVPEAPLRPEDVERQLR